jgi:hypothetical protein
MILAGVWKKLRNEELLDCYFPRNTARRTELRGVRWAGHVASIRGWEFINTVISIPEESRTVGRPEFG